MPRLILPTMPSTNRIMDVMSKFTVILITYTIHISIGQRSSNVKHSHEMFNVISENIKVKN